ncbi:MAG TPA: metal ABC transporter substrate-binding protein [Ignavibacteriaceae bacterium]|nr:metal ABC transporter substrate-binding protein [Ignavibacteriaceae bacterium]
MKKIILLALFFIFNITFAQVNVVTTTSTIYDIVKEIGKDKVEVDYLCRGDQDPHFLEIKPSYMMKLRKADILMKIGLGLEMWAQQLIDGSRNSKLEVIDLSIDISKKEVPTGKVDASQGDIHPYGNPHYWLDPENIKVMAKEIYEALSNKDSENSSFYKKNYEAYSKKLDSKISEWKNKMSGLKDRPIVFFHASWIYFADRFGIKIAGYVEPKPGITPTPSHNADVINLVKKNKITKIVMENFYSDNAPNQIAEKTGAKVIKVPVNVYGMEGVDTYIKMMDYIINQVTK